MKKSFFIISIATLAIIGCNNNNNTSENNPENIENTKITLNPQELKNLKISTDTLHKMNISQTLHFKGKIDVPPQNIYSLSVPLGGYLKYTHLLPGMHIQKGEVIAVLEDPQYIQLQEDYLNTKTLLTLAEKNYTRQKELWEQKAVSDKTFEQAQSELESQKIKLKSLEEKLKLININANELTADKISKSINLYAPFTGYVTAVHYSTGKYIAPSEVLFELVNPDDIHLNIKVYEKDLPYLKIGQKVYAYTNYNPNKKYLCEVILVNKMVSNDGSIDIHCHFDKYDEALIPGTYMQADVIIQDSNVYALPSKAVVFNNNHYYVFVQNKNNEFEMVEVKKMYESEGYTAIENYQDLSGKKIVTENAYALLMKAKNVEE